MKFHEISFFPLTCEYELTYFTKASLITNVMMLLISIFFDKYINTIGFDQIYGYFLISFLTFILCTISIYLHYRFIDEKIGQFIFFFCCAISIGILYPTFLNSHIFKYVLISIILLFGAFSCLSARNIKIFNVIFINFMLILIALCLIISFGIRQMFSIRGNYSALICTLILATLYQYFIKRGLRLKMARPIRRKLATAIFFFNIAVSLQTFFSWLPINPFSWNLQYLPYKYIAITFLFHLYMALINNSIKIRSDLNITNY
jgi:hypothetical protein